jgi:hypothetical protein
LARSVFARALPAIGAPLPGWSAPVLLTVGGGFAVVALARFAVYGFAPDGRFPTGYAALYAAAMVVLSVTVRRRAEVSR